jgi:hypothetical protein
MHRGEVSTVQRLGTIPVRCEHLARYRHLLTVLTAYGEGGTGEPWGIGHERTVHYDRGNCTASTLQRRCPVSD